MKGTLFPELRGRLISQSPANRPKELLLGIEDANRPDCRIILDEAYRYPAARGTLLRFQGVPVRFSKDPFMVVFEVEKDKLKGWPPPPARRRRGGRR